MVTRKHPEGETPLQAADVTFLLINISVNMLESLFFCILGSVQTFRPLH